MSQFLRCDICGEEISSSKSDLDETAFVGGAVAGEQLHVMIRVRRARAMNPIDLCWECFLKAALTPLGARP